MRKGPQDLKIFKDRKERLGKLISGSALILPAHPEQIRNNDVHHAYRQDSNLYFLTGFEEPGSVFLFRPGLVPESVLFVRKKDPLRETWDGFRFGVEGAKEAFGMDETYDIEDFEKEAPKLLKDVNKIYYSLFQNRKFDHRLQSVIESIKDQWGRSGRGNMSIKDSYPLLGELRLRKTPEDIELMRKACQISAEAHIEVMKHTHPGVNERALQGVFISAIMQRGSAREGYGSIMASGNNATTLHYVFNDQNLKDGDLLLVDAGAEFKYYTGDITRTYPVNGKFSPVQKRIYEKVLTVQKNLVASAKPGAALAELQNQAIDELTQIMIEEKLLKGSKKKLIEEKAYKKFYPHGVGHWLGIDVHDAGTYEVNEEPRRLEPGMCFTIEPGLYIPHDATDVPEDLKGIGVRIEDNIVITDRGNENLTEQVPKEVADLEAIIGSHEKTNHAL